jgi:acetoacetyl-CoA synthetase
VLATRTMPGARWFEGAQLNFAEHLLRRNDNGAAIIHGSESEPPATISMMTLRARVGAAQRGLLELGVRRGDRVVSYMPNIPETVVAFLACAGIGATWSSCAPDFGTRAVLDRFRQLEPTVLLAADGYRFGRHRFGRMTEVEQLAEGLPSLKATVVLPLLETSPSLARVRRGRSWGDVMEEGSEPTFLPLPFDHPLWVVYSSGTTGSPKGMVHGHGGILLESMKQTVLHFDLGPEDRFLWFTTTGWVMWNILVGGLVSGAAIALYDGSPASPDMLALWRFAALAGITYFGTSAAFVQACMKAGINPGAELDLSRIRRIGSTGSPLVPEAYQWLMEKTRPGLPVSSVSGGTDICGGFLSSSPLLPVHAGELQCAALGVDVQAYDETGNPVTGEVGELVVTQPMPSMPIYFWDDADGRRYHESYFDTYPGLWRHGDWLQMTDRGTGVIYGRSDATLNRGGVRMGTSEFYRVIEELPEVADSLVVDLSELGRPGRLLLFVVPAGDSIVDEKLVGNLKTLLRKEVSPRHVPDEILQIAAVPRTLNGKKLEVPVKRILNGVPVDRAVSLGAVVNPESLQAFVEMATAG